MEPLVRESIGTTSECIAREELQERLFHREFSFNHSRVRLTHFNTSDHCAYTSNKKGTYLEIQTEEVA